MAVNPFHHPVVGKCGLFGWHNNRDLSSLDLWSFRLLRDGSPQSPHLGVGLNSVSSVKHFSSAATANLFGPVPLAEAQPPSRDIHTPIPTWKHMLLSKHSWFPVARIHVRRYWGAPLQHAGEWVGVWLAVCGCIFEGVCVYVCAVVSKQEKECKITITMGKSGCVWMGELLQLQNMGITNQKRQVGLGVEWLTNNQKVADSNHGADTLFYICPKTN